MADRAFVTTIQEVYPDSADSSITVIMNVKIFSDIDMGGLTSCEARMLWTDTGAVWYQKMTAAIIAKANSMGFTSLLAAQVRIPTYQAGS